MASWLLYPIPTLLLLHILRLLLTRKLLAQLHAMLYLKGILENLSLDRTKAVIIPTLLQLHTLRLLLDNKASGAASRNVVSQQYPSDSRTCPTTKTGDFGPLLSILFLLLDLWGGSGEEHRQCHMKDQHGILQDGKA